MMSTHPSRRGASIPTLENTRDVSVSELAGHDTLESFARVAGEFPDRSVAIERVIGEEGIAPVGPLAQQVMGSAEARRFPTLTNAAKELESGATADGEVEALAERTRVLAPWCGRVRASVLTA